MKLYIKKISKDLPTPKYMTEGAAGMDLYAAVEGDTIIKKGEIKLIPTGIAISIESGYEAQVRPRSGLAIKNGLGLVNSPGTIDSDYRGEINLIMINFGTEDFTIKRGDRVAQMVINKIKTPDIIEVEELDDTERAAGGFGSTGL
ncbi:MAG: dUTP diphosphatase [Clostridium sp.]|uniref:dUTP diphosphatase n=1 Tax=Clostridium sp. TaxID=1506 RepID=UPI002FCA8694